MTTQQIVKLAAGNPGALDVLCKMGTELSAEEKETVVRLLTEYRITGSRLYVLYNDCCGRDLPKTIKALTTLPEDELDKLITGDGVRGYPVSID